MVPPGVVDPFVDPQHQRRIHFRSGRRNHHLLHRPAQVFAGIGSVGEQPRALQHDLDSQRRPVNLGRIAHLEDLDPPAIHADGVGLGFDLPAEIPQDRVVLEQMGQGARVGDVVHRDEIQLGIVQ